VRQRGTDIPAGERTNVRIRFTSVVATRKNLYRTPAIRTFEVVRVLFGALLVSGGVAAATGWRPAIALVAAGLGGAVLSHVVVGVLGYRRAMRSSGWADAGPGYDPSDDDWY
jgi:hypothetical protein